MSTRCQIGFYRAEEKDLNKFEALIYRHSDGYPGAPTEEDYGALWDIYPEMYEFNKKRGLEDIEYASAWLMYILKRDSIEHNEKMNKILGRNKHKIVPIQKSIHYLGHGISKDFHGDIEYYYAIYPQLKKRIDISNGQKMMHTKVIAEARIDIYEPTHTKKNFHMKNAKYWKKIGSIEISDNGLLKMIPKIKDEEYRGRLKKLLKEK